MTPSKPRIRLLLGGGSLVLTTEGDRIFTQEHTDFISLLKEPFSIAMSNALKHREILKLKDLLADDNRYLQGELHRLSGNEVILKDPRKASEAERNIGGTDNLDDVISRQIRRVLAKTRGKVSGHDGAAALLGINPSTLRHRMKKLGIEYGKGSKS